MAGTTEEEARRLRRVKRTLLGAVLIVVFVAGCRAVMPQGRVTALIDGRSLSLDVAATREARERGLQGYADLPDGRGMLFVNDAPVPVSIEMKSVRFPIDVAFVDERMRVAKVASLYPDVPREITSSSPALYVIETPEGWLAANGIGVGSTLAFFGERP